MGNRTLVQDSLSGTTTSTYDAANRLTVREYGGPSQTKLKFEDVYTVRDQLETETRYNWNGSAWVNIGTTSYSYDPSARLTNIKHRDNLAAVVGNYTYTFDSADRVTAKTENGTTTSYSYDNANQLTADGATNYTYDSNGNRNSGGSTVGTGNQITTSGKGTYTYDAEGDRTKKSKGAAQETWTYGYDLNNQLIWAEKRATDGGTLQLRVDYKYDAEHRRIERTADTDGNGTTDTTERYALNGDNNTFADLDGSNVLTMRRLYGVGVDQPTVRLDSGGTATWYLRDYENSVIGLANASGGLIGAIAYDGFGNVLTDTTGGAIDRVRYTAREYDSATALQFNHARWYDAATGTWTSQDPLGFEAGDANLYRYVGNHGTYSTDPSGQVIVVQRSQADGIIKALARAGLYTVQTEPSTPTIGDVIKNQIVDPDVYLLPRDPAVLQQRYLQHKAGQRAELVEKTASLTAELSAEVKNLAIQRIENGRLVEPKDVKKYQDDEIRTLALVDKIAAVDQKIKDRDNPIDTFYEAILNIRAKSIRMNSDLDMKEANFSDSQQQTATRIYEGYVADMGATPVLSRGNPRSEAEAMGYHLDDLMELKRTQPGLAIFGPGGLAEIFLGTVAPVAIMSGGNFNGRAGRYERIIQWKYGRVAPAASTRPVTVRPPHLKPGQSLPENEIVTMVGGNSADKFKLNPPDSLPIEGVTQPGKSAGITIDLTPQSDVAQAFGRPAQKGDILIGASVKDIRVAGFDVVYAPTRENPLHVRIVEGTGKFSNQADRDLLTLAFDRLGKAK